MVKRGELTDEAWARIAPLLPENGRRGSFGLWEREARSGQGRMRAEVRREKTRSPSQRPLACPNFLWEVG
jgi:hypothetical protein